MSENSRDMSPRVLIPPWPSFAADVGDQVLLCPDGRFRDLPSRRLLGSVFIAPFRGHLTLMRPAHG
jgi:hypothetical protein